MNRLSLQLLVLVQSVLQRGKKSDLAKASAKRVCAMRASVTSEHAAEDEHAAEHRASKRGTPEVFLDYIVEPDVGMETEIVESRSPDIEIGGEIEIGSRPFCHS